MLRINQEEPLFQLGQDFRTSKFFTASDIGGSSKIAKISIIQVLEGLFWDLEVWIESAVARQSMFTLLGFESLQSHWPWRLGLMNNLKEREDGKWERFSVIISKPDQQKAFHFSKHFTPVLGVSSVELIFEHWGETLEDKKSYWLVCWEIRQNETNTMMSPNALRSQASLWVLAVSTKAVLPIPFLLTLALHCHSTLHFNFSH